MPDQSRLRRETLTACKTYFSTLQSCATCWYADVVWMNEPPRIGMWEKFVDIWNSSAPFLPLLVRWMVERHQLGSIGQRLDGDIGPHCSVQYVARGHAIWLSSTVSSICLAADWPGGAMLPSPHVGQVATYSQPTARRTNPCLRQCVVTTTVHRRVVPKRLGNFGVACCHTTIAAVDVVWYGGCTSCTVTKISSSVMWRILSKA